MERKWRVAVVGATGMVGQRFVSLLADHPWFEIAVVAASARSAGKTYEEAVSDRWAFDWPIPQNVRPLVVRDASDVAAVTGEVDFVFCAVDMKKDEIRALEDAYAKSETPVVSNNSAHRGTPDVPMIVPEPRNAPPAGVSPRVLQGDAAPTATANPGAPAPAPAPMQAPAQPGAGQPGAPAPGGDPLQDALEEALGSISGVY